MVLNTVSYDDIIQNKVSSSKSVAVVDLLNKCTRIDIKLLNAFPNLVSVINAKNVKIIDDYAFDVCSKLSSILLDDTIEYIGKNAFDETSISAIKIPSKLKTISDEAFVNCVALRHITFSDNAQLNEIKNSAFGNCIALESITLPEKLKLIDECSFAECANLQTVFIPKTVECIKNGAFYNCKKLKQVIFY